MAHDHRNERVDGLQPTSTGNYIIREALVRSYESHKGHLSVFIYSGSNDRSLRCTFDHYENFFSNRAITVESLFEETTFESRRFRVQFQQGLSWAPGSSFQSSLAR